MTVPLNTRETPSLFLSWLIVFQYFSSRTTSLILPHYTISDRPVEEIQLLSLFRRDFPTVNFTVDLLYFLRLTVLPQSVRYYSKQPSPTPPQQDPTPLLIMCSSLHPYSNRTVLSLITYLYNFGAVSYFRWSLPSTYILGRSRGGSIYFLFRGSKFGISRGYKSPTHLFFYRCFPFSLIP